MAHMDLHEFRSERARMNDQILGEDHLGIKRYFNLDSNAYKEGGALPKKTLEFMGLVASVVLRCDDCIAYHLDQLVTTCDATKDELLEGLNVALVVGGSITIPHLRRAWDLVGQLFDDTGGTATTDSS